MENYHDRSISMNSSSDLSCSIHLVLPHELERDIFERAASSFPECAPTLVLVARRVKEWIEPLIYDMLVFSFKFPNYPPIYEGVSRLRVTRTPLFDKAVKHARYVLLEGVKTMNVAEVLQHCVNVKSLGLWGLPALFEDQRPLLPLIQSLPLLERLSASPRDLQQVKGVRFEFDHTIFMNLTHLEILCMEDDICEWERWRKLALLPKLTHLSVDYSTPEFVGKVLEECPNIQLFVVFYEDRQDILTRAWEWGEEGIRHARHADVGSMTDKRIVQIPVVHDWIQDWEQGARDQEDFWKRAEKIQANRFH